ncbi:MAG: hypothetical protein ACI8ZV_000598 [Chitinophagales bacterium]
MLCEPTFYGDLLKKHLIYYWKKPSVSENKYQFVIKNRMFPKKLFSRCSCPRTLEAFLLLAGYFESSFSGFVAF